MIEIIIIALISLLTAGTFITPIFQTIIYNYGRKFRREYEKEHHKTILLVPVKREPAQVLLRFFRENREIVSRSLATFLICDEYSLEEIENIIKELFREKLTENVIFFLSKSSKNKAQALNKALRSIVSTRDFKIVVVDVDSILTCTSPTNVDIVSSIWRGYSTIRSLLGRGQEIGYRLFMKMLNGLYMITGWRPTLGSGLVLSSRSIRELGAFNEDVILEDVEYSIRAISRGYRISVFTNYVINVQVPSTYNALLRQQVRWAYGAGELLRKYSRYIMRKPVIGLYLSQYLSYPFQLILAIVLYLCSIFRINIPMILQVIILLLIVYTSCTYAIWCLQEIGFKSISDVKSSLVSINRVNMAYAVMSPRIFASFLSGIIGVPFRWIPTPKIETLPPVKDRLRMYIVELLFSIILLALLLFSLLEGSIFQLYMIDPVAFTITYVWGTFRVVERELT
ncbi:MAG: glycosyltransferase family 2 protein [Crenarchaeota archaeon]|nr:glycosyltransferase family 2 protein [Thermoproteota archaeon]